MPYQSGLLSDFWKRYAQRRANTGRGLTSSEVTGLLEPMLAYDTQKAIAAGERERQQLNFNRQMSLQEQAQRDAASAAKLSGLTQLGGLVGQGYLGYKGLQLAGQQAQAQSQFNQGLLGLLGGGGQATEFANALPALPPASTYTTLSSGLANAPSYAIGGPTSFAEQAAAANALAADVGATTAAAPAAEVLGLSAGPAALVGGATGYLGSRLFGANKDITEAATLGGAGALAGAAIGAGAAVGGPVGALIGGVIGVGASLIDDVSVICTELLRQGRISISERKMCIRFRYKYIPDDMFKAYLIWAKPIVDLMHSGGIVNKLLLPFTMRFTSYMVKVERNILPSFLERMVWKYAWHKCSKIAKREAFYGGSKQWVS